MTPEADLRDQFGRLYAAFDPGIVMTALGSAAILFDEATMSASSGKAIHRVIARKRGGGGVARRKAIRIPGQPLR